MKTKSPEFFENLVVDLLVAMGYGGSRKDAGQAVGQVGDGGIDGIIKEDKLGLDAIYLQAKRWEGTVGGPIVQGFVGALIGKKARKGVFITTSTFSQQAISYANGIENLKIILIDGEQLAQLMIDHDVGVTVESRYIVKKVDLDYFGDEQEIADCHCDVCRRGRDPVEQVEDATPLPDEVVMLVRQLLSGVARLRGKFGVGVVAEERKATNHPKRLDMQK